MISAPFSFPLIDADATARCAAALAAHSAVGDMILLEGDVGAGKTHFARSFIQSLLRVPEDVPSPTFTLVQTYETPGGEIWHADLYRLTGTQEIEELGLLEAFDTAVCLVEWPDRLGDLTPADALTISLSQGPNDSRVLQACWSDPKWLGKLGGWPA